MDFNFEDLRSEIQKALGVKHCYLSLDEQSKPEEAIPSGILALDIALGIGGYPRGRIVEIFGPESSGKTLLCLGAIAEAQKMFDKPCAFIDIEQAFDRKWAEKNKVLTNKEKLIFLQSDVAEDCLETIEILAKKEVPLIVVDSIAAMIPKNELAGEYSDSQVGLLARLMTKACKRLVPLINETQTTIIFINQIRDKIATGRSGFGGPLFSTPGGHALKHGASVRLSTYSLTEASLKDENVVSGRAINVSIIKNKVAPPYKEARFVLDFSKGLDPVINLVDVATTCGVITKAGAWFTFKDQTITDKQFQGRANLVLFLEENMDLIKTLSDQVKKIYDL